MGMPEFLFAVLLISASELAGCNSISNTNFNDNLRNYSVIDKSTNLTSVKTMQTNNLERYANYAPERSTIKLQEIPDNVLSSSSYSRGLLHHEQSGYGFNDYEDPHFVHGYEYQIHNSGHHDPHDHHHYDYHDSGHHHSPNHHLGYGNHHKHYDHGLAAKTLLWPIAAIGLLGAAAALVSNPVLLQLGVVSGRRKRRDTEEDFKPDVSEESLKKWSPNADKVNQGALNNYVINSNSNKNTIKRRMLHRNDILKQVKVIKHDYSTEGPTFETIAAVPEKHRQNNYDDRYVPIPLILKKD